MDHAKNIRTALINGEKSPPLSAEAKIAQAKRVLGDRYILNGGKADWSRPTVLPHWLANRPGAVQRAAC